MNEEYKLMYDNTLMYLILCIINHLIYMLICMRNII